MNLVTPLNRVLGLGTASGAAEHWWHQRLTAVALVPLALWFAYGLTTLPALDWHNGMMVITSRVHSWPGGTTSGRLLPSHVVSKIGGVIGSRTHPSAESQVVFP